MNKILAAVGAISLGFGSLKAGEEKNIPTEVSSIAIVSGEHIGIKSTIATTANQVSTHLTHGDDPRMGAQDFTSGGISWTDKNHTLGARGLLLNNESFGEIYGKLTDKIDLFKGVDAWVRVGVTAPTGFNLSSGANIGLTDHDSLFLLGSHQEAFSDGPQGTLGKAQMTHDFGNGISLYGSLDYWDGDDASFPGANLLDNNGPGSQIFTLHGKDFTGNVGVKCTHDKASAHLKASYNEGKYWNFLGEISRQINENMTLSGGILIDTRDTAATTGYVGVKWKF